MSEELKFKLKEIIIPIELFENKSLTFTDYCIFSVIKELDEKEGCSASNKQLACILNISERQTTKSITNLKENNYLRQESFDGRKRILRINESMFH